MEKNGEIVVANMGENKDFSKEYPPMPHCSQFWVLGGSTGDDSYDHTITDKVQAYSPQEQTWSVEVRPGDKETSL